MEARRKQGMKEVRGLKDEEEERRRRGETGKEEKCYA